MSPYQSDLSQPPSPTVMTSGDMAAGTARGLDASSMAVASAAQPPQAIAATDPVCILRDINHQLVEIRDCLIKRNNYLGEWEKRNQVIEMRRTDRLNKRPDTFMAERAALDAERAVLDAELRKLQCQWESERI